MRTIILLLCPQLLAEEIPKPAPTPKVSTELKLSLKSAEAAAQDAMIALLQTEAYANLQAAQKRFREIHAAAQRQAGCEIDLRTLECIPPPAKPKPEAK